jgi:D-3-phosphoglycerate dehydrogenase
MPSPAGSGNGPLRALLAENIHPNAVEVLESAGLAVESITHAMGEDELAERLQGTSFLGIRSGTHVSAEALKQAPDLRAIGAFCIGTNQIDLHAATSSGVAVFNAPFSNTRSVVEIALGEIIALTRRLVVHNEAMHAGRWVKSASGSHEIRGRKLGIVGYGNIGSQLSVLAEALGMEVYFYDTADKLALGNARRCTSLEDLLHVADVVTLHVDGRSGNSGLFGEEQFAQMRPRSLFLNLSRGFVVDHHALAEHVQSGHLAGAAVDVFPDEPSGPGDPFTSELRGLPNVILTPHIGGSTEEAQADIGRFVAHKLAAYLTSGTTTLSVNLPGVQLPRPQGTTRLLLLHTNTPGVLAAVNGVLGERGVNIEQQVLATAGHVGYVMTDIPAPAASADDDLLHELRSMPATIRLDALS